MPRDGLTALLAGTPVTVEMTAPTSGERAAVAGLVADASRASGADRWWPWASFRMVGAALHLLTCTGVGGKATWVAVAQVSGMTMTWCGIGGTDGAGYSRDEQTSLRQNLRERMTVAALRAMGFTCDAAYTDAYDVATMNLRAAALCASGCGRVLTSARSLRSGYGPTCDGTEPAGRARTDAKRATARALTPAEMHARISARAKGK